MSWHMQLLQNVLPRFTMFDCTMFYHDLLCFAYSLVMSSGSVRCSNGGDPVRRKIQTWKGLG